MAEYLIQGGTLTAIAGAIREKTGNSNPLSPSQMVDEIMSISSGGGLGGQSSVITFESTTEEILSKYPIVMMEDGVFVRISDATPTLDELIGGIVGSPLDGTEGRMICFPIVEQFELENSNQLFAVEVDESLTDATAVISHDGEIVLGSFGKESAAIMSEMLGQDTPPGIWVSIAWMGFNSEKWEFALAYNAKEPEEEWILDGKTHIWIELREGRTSPVMGIGVNGTVTIDWGDGTAPDVLTGTNIFTTQWTPKHEYGKAGKYIITLTVEGQVGLAGSSQSSGGAYLLRNSSEDTDGRNYVYKFAIKKIEFGSGIYIGNYALGYNTHIREIYLPDSMTKINGNFSLSNVGVERFVFPDSVSSIGMGFFQSCDRLREVVLSQNITKISSSLFSHCRSLINVKIPPNVVSVASSSFAYCTGMKVYDFTALKAVPTLENVNAFGNNSGDFEIRVPAALAEEWKAATNWSEYADYIVGV